MDMYFRNLKKLENIRKNLIFGLKVNIVLFFACIFLWFKIVDIWWIVCGMCVVLLLIFININLEKQFYKKFVDIIINPILSQYNLFLTKSNHKNINLPYIVSSTSFNLYYIQSDDFCIYDIKTPYDGLIDDIRHKKQSINTFKLAYDKYKSSKQASFNGFFVMINKICKENIELIGHSSIKMETKTPLLLDNVLINDFFDVYASDKIGAFRVLTPAFSQSLVDNLKALDTAVSIILSKNGAFLFISCNFLRPDIYVKLTQEIANQYDEKLKSIINIIKLIKDNC